MSDTVHSDAPEPYVSRSAGGEGPLDFRSAARSLIDARNKDNAATVRAQEVPTPPAAPEPPQPEPVEETGGDPPEEVPTETTAPDPAAASADQPPIDAPSSWTKAEKERFKSLPRETQEYLATREQQRDRDIRTRQNEFAEKSKGLEAQLKQAEEVRKQYETALPLLLNNLQQTLAGEFADVRTMADVQKMAQDDWPRYIRWDAHQKQIAAVQQEVTTAQQRQATEHQTAFNKYAAEQDALFIDRVPEFKDSARAEKLQGEARKVLADMGFSEEELIKSWNGQGNLSLRDHRVQLLIKKAVESEVLAAEKARGLKNVATKELPPVLRPGVAGTKETSFDQKIKSLQEQQKKATGMRSAQLGAEILKLQRARVAAGG